MSDFPHILAENLFQDAALTYDKTPDAVYVPEFLADRSRLSKFVGENATPQHLIFDLAAAQEADCFVLDKDFIVTGGGSRHLKLQHSATEGTDNGSTWDVDAVDLNNAALADTTLPIWKSFTAVTRRYWRLRLEGISAAPEIFNAWLSMRIQLTFGPYGNFDPWAESSQDTPTRSSGGGFQNVHNFKHRIFRATWENLVDAKMALIDLWWANAGSQGLNWWFLWEPTAYSDSPGASNAPIYLNSAGRSREFGFYRSIRTGIIEGEEVL